MTTDKKVKQYRWLNSDSGYKVLKMKLSYNSVL